MRYRKIEIQTEKPRDTERYRKRQKETERDIKRQKQRQRDTERKGLKSMRSSNILLNTNIAPFVSLHIIL